MKESLEKINEIEDESTNDESVIEYLSSKIKCKFESKMGSMHLTNRKIYDLRERFTIDDIMINLNKHEEKGVSDFLINLMNTNPKILDKSFFYLNQLITMLSYKKYIYPYEQYICDKGICFIKFSVRISLYLNSFEKEHKGIRIMKFKIEQIMRANYSDIQDSQYQPKKKLKEDDFIITGAKNKNDMQVNYYYRCLEFFENLKKLCLLLFNYPIKLEGNTTDKKMTRKTALKEFIKLFNEDMHLMREEEYDKMNKEEKINKKKN